MLRRLRSRWVGQDWRHNLFDAVLAAAVISTLGYVVGHLTGLIGGSDDKAARMQVTLVQVIEPETVGQIQKIDHPWPIINVHYAMSETR